MNKYIALLLAVIGALTLAGCVQISEIPPQTTASPKPSTTATSSQARTTPTPTPTPTQILDNQALAEQVIEVLSDAVKSDYPKALDENTVQVLRDNTGGGVKCNNRAITGQSEDALVWCNGNNTLYIPEASLDTARANSKLDAVLHLAKGYGGYLLQSNGGANREGFQVCMVGYFSTKLLWSALVPNTSATKVRATLNPEQQGWFDHGQNDPSYCQHGN